MNEDFILPHEFLLLMLWLCAPAVAIALAVLSWFFARHGLFRRGSSWRAVVGLLATTIGTLVLSVPVWLVTPNVLLPDDILGSLVPPFFLPSFVAALSVAALSYWWAMRGRWRRSKSVVPGV